ncbi:MAG: VOC family protein [Roseivirga sp.]|nr:VOC family protein [Roseivirga sp.]
MKRILLSALAMFLVINIQAQSPQVTFDHMSLVVKDLSTTIDFYVKVLGFHRIDDPTGVATIDWVENQTGQQLHFSQGDMSEIKFSKSVHMSFGVDALAPFIANLEKHNIPYESWTGDKSSITIRADGIRQIYINDPNGYWIEINDRVTN